VIQVRTFPDIEAYYEAEPAARLSPESDYGCWWRDADGGVWRVSYVHETGDVYAIRSRGVESGLFRLGQEVVALVSSGRAEGPVVILGRLAPWTEDQAKASETPHRPMGIEPPPSATALEGWADFCGAQGSLDWVYYRVVAFSARS